MKGTNVTSEQYVAAERFILEVAMTNLPKPMMEEQVVQNQWGDLVRLVAWYGAIRYRSGEKGIGSLERPAGIVEKNS